MGPNSDDLRPSRTIRVVLVTASIVAGLLVLTAAGVSGIDLHSVPGTGRKTGILGTINNS